MPVKIPFVFVLTWQDFPPGDGKGSTKFLCFLHQLGDKKSTVKWDTAVKGGRMFIQLPDDPLHECSRDRYVIYIILNNVTCLSFL